MAKQKNAALIPYESMNAAQKLEYLKNQFGIDETLDVLEFLVSIAVAYKKAKANDGKITIGDAMYFLEPIALFPSAMTGIDSVPYELQDELTEEERSEMLAVVIRAGVIPEKAEDVVNDALDLAENIKAFVLNHFVEPALK